MAFYRLDPWDEARADLRAGIIASTIANYSGNRKKDAPPRKPRDFMPYAEKPEQDPEGLSQQLAMAFGKDKQ